ncbi:MAG TPA: hybrid sensor histidine kinase/response regulator [Microscillaceae bacterium]|nr:hybrid sensor histidine kinase/response regulator [Microscillaceae bacterium]
MRVIYFSLLIACLICSTHTQGQNFSHIRHYTTDDGLPHNVGYSLMQDSKGFLWICTDDGLARFDGKEFKVYRSKDGLLSNYPIDITEDQEGTLWIGSWKGGVNYLKKDSIYTPTIDYPRFKVGNIDIQGDQMMLSSERSDVHFYQKKGQQWYFLNKRVNTRIFMKNDSILSYSHHEIYSKLNSFKRITLIKGYLTTDQSKLIFGGFAGIWKYQNDSTFVPFFPEVIQKDTVYYVTQDAQQRYWLGGRGKLWAIDASGPMKIWTKNLPPYRIHDIKPGIDGKLYFLTGLTNLNNRGFYCYDPTTQQLEDLMKKYKLRAFPSSLEIDQEGNLWFTTNGDGVYCITYSLFKNYDAQQGLTGEFVQQIHQDKHGTVYIGTSNGLYKYGPSGFNQVTLLSNASSIDITQLSLSSKGNLMLLASLKEGYQLFEVDQVQQARVIKLDKGIEKHLYKDIRNKIWHFGDNAISSRNLQKETGKQAWWLHKFSNDFLISSLFDYENKLWMATNQGLYVFRENRQKAKPKIELLDSLKVADGLPSNFVNTVAKGANGELWIGTKEGVCYYQNGEIRKITAKNDFVLGNCTSLVIDHWGGVWVGTSKGLAYFDGERFVNYNHKTGLVSPSINCLFLDKRKRLWVGTSKGISMMEISQKPGLVTAPRFYIEKILVNRKPIKISSEVILQYNQRLDIQFQALTFVYPEGIHYQYRLDDEPWQDTRLNFLNYNRFPTGYHTLELRARKYNSDWSTIRGIVIEVNPPYWLTWWAFSAYVVLAILVVYAIIRWRSRQLIKDKLRLERLVAKRTQELEHQKEEIASQAEKLKEMDQVKSRFFANISHEFKTPLTLIIGPAEKLLGVKKLSPVKMYSQYILANAHRLMKLINQLMDVSKIDSGKMFLQVKRGNLTTFLTQIFHSFELLAQQKNIQMELQIPEKEMVGDFDEDKIEKIFFNLLSNALKFTPEGGKVSFAITQTGNQISATIADNGAGIAEEQLVHIFDRFYQADDSGTRAHEGTGIGLALVKELVTLHEGTIKVESQLQQGTTFTVVLPFEQKALIDLAPNTPTDVIAPVMREELPIIEDVTAEKNTVLIVEDNREIKDFIAAELAPFYTVLSANNGAEGIASALEHVPDLIVSDVMMPKVDGLEMVKQLREHEVTSHIPMMLLSAKSDFESKIAGLETGGDDYLTKPFSAKELLLRVKNMLDRRDKLREALSRQIVRPENVAELPQRAMPSKEEAFLKKMTEIVEQNMDKPNFDVGYFCQEIGMSRSNLFRKMKALTNQSIVEFIRGIRLRKAATLLKETNDKVESIALQVGFNDISYFNKCFKKQFGVTPSKYE